MLDGFELPAGAWERAVLPARMDRYEPSMLDMLCLSGEVGWARLSTPRVLKMASVDAGRAVPPRARASVAGAARADERTERASPTTRGSCSTCCSARGASFFKDLLAGAALRCRPACGRRSACWSLRVWQSRTASPACGCSSPRRRDGRSRRSAHELRRPLDALVPRDDDPRTPRGGGRTQAHALLRRYGVVFRRLLTREPNAAPWRELTRVYRRLEARGEIRGGRFVSGMAGEQFALPDAVPTLREVRRTPASGSVLHDLHRRSAQPDRHRHRRSRACVPPAATGWPTATACRWRSSKASKRGRWRRSMRRICLRSRGFCCAGARVEWPETRLLSHWVGV